MLELDLMIGNLPAVCFDTSAHNRLVDDGVRSEPIIAGLRSGFFFRFTGLSIEELVSCPDPDKRAALFTCCARLQHGSSDCIFPPNELIRDLILAHSENPAFDWKTVDVRAIEFERGIQRRKIILDAELSAEQRADQIQRQSQYRHMFSDIRPRIEAVFAEHGEALPTSFRGVLSRMQGGDSKLMLGIGKLLYDRAADADVTEQAIEQFISICPPFRALLYGVLMSWFDLAVRHRHAGERFAAGRNDLFMSVYLPYCDHFVTAEVQGEQEKCLREIAVLAEIDCGVIAYDDFCAGFLVGV